MARKTAQGECEKIIFKIIKDGNNLSVGDMIALMTIDRLATSMGWLELSEDIRFTLRRADPIGRHKANELLKPIGY